MQSTFTTAGKVSKDIPLGTFTAETGTDNDFDVSSSTGTVSVISFGTIFTPSILRNGTVCVHV